MLRFRLREALARLADGSVDALVWSGGVPTPAIAELDAELPLRILDIGPLAAPMSHLAGYPYVVRRVPTGAYVPPGIRSIGVPDLLLCRQDIAADLVAAVVDVLATDAPQLVPPYVRGLQYLDPPSMIQTGLIPLHPGAVQCLPEAPRLSVNPLDGRTIRQASRAAGSFRESVDRARNFTLAVAVAFRAGGGRGPIMSRTRQPNRGHHDDERIAMSAAQELMVAVPRHVSRGCRSSIDLGGRLPLEQG